MSKLDELYRRVLRASDDRNDEVILRALNDRPRVGSPPDLTFFDRYDWEDDIFGDLDPALFFSTKNGHSEWWQKHWEQHVWLDRPNVWFGSYERDGEVVPGWTILGLHSPESFRRVWFDMQKSRTGGELWYGCSEELSGAIISNPKLRVLVRHWCRRQLSGAA